MFLLDYFYGNPTTTTTNTTSTKDNNKEAGAAGAGREQQHSGKGEEEWVWVDESVVVTAAVADITTTTTDPTQLERENQLLENVTLVSSVVVAPGACLEVPELAGPVVVAEPQAVQLQPHLQPTQQQSTKLRKLKSNTSNGGVLKPEVRNTSASILVVDNNKSMARKNGRRSGYYKTPAKTSRVNNDRKCGGRGF